MRRGQWHPRGWDSLKAVKEASPNYSDRQRSCLVKNQTQPGHYLGTFAALVLSGLGWEMFVPQAAATSQHKLVHGSAPDISSFPHEAPSDLEPSSEELNHERGGLDAELQHLQQQLEPIQWEHT